MAQLKCDVTSCASNVSCQCSRPSISVNGKSASSKIETSCSSYQNIYNSGVSNCACTQSPNPCPQIKCSASDCAYNEFGKCQSKSVAIEGAGARSVTETMCSSFKKR